MTDSGICMCILTLFAFVFLRYIVLNPFSFLKSHALSAEMRLLICTLSNLEIFTLFFTESLVLFITLVNNLLRVSNHYQLSTEVLWKAFAFWFKIQALIGTKNFSDLPSLRSITENNVITECKEEKYDDYRNGTLPIICRLHLPAYNG